MAAPSVHRALPDFVLHTVGVAAAPTLAVTRERATSSFALRTVAESVAATKGAPSQLSEGRACAPITVAEGVVLWKDATNLRNLPLVSVLNTVAARNVPVKDATRWLVGAHLSVQPTGAVFAASSTGAIELRSGSTNSAGRTVVPRPDRNRPLLWSSGLFALFSISRVYIISL